MTCRHLCTSLVLAALLLAGCGTQDRTTIFRAKNALGRREKDIEELVEVRGSLKRIIETKVTAADLDLKAESKQPKRETLQEARDRAERAPIENAMTLARGNISNAAKMLEISRPRLYNLLRRHGMDT